MHQRFVLCVLGLPTLTGLSGGAPRSNSGRPTLTFAPSVLSWSMFYKSQTERPSMSGRVDLGVRTIWSWWKAGWIG